MCNLEACELNSKNKYGGYCYKHRQRYLVKNDLIIVENFTNNHSDYLKKDIINSIKKYDDITSVNTKLKKEESNRTQLGRHLLSRLGLRAETETQHQTAATNKAAT